MLKRTVEKIVRSPASRVFSTNSPNFSMATNDKIEKSTENVESATVKRHLSPENVKNDDVVDNVKRQKNDDEEKPEKQKFRLKYHKYAMYLSYCGQGYFGMQINGDTPTVEREILNAFFKCDLIDDEDCRKPGGKLNFQRAARTDKNVSAVKQLCSLKLPRVDEAEKLNEWTTKLNEILPKQIKIWGFTKVTQSFNSKTWGDSRTYTYTMPSFAFAKWENKADENYRLTDKDLEELNEILANFKGTKNFYNFTSNRKPDDRSCIRYIISCSCDPPFIKENVEFVTIVIHGQSFMLHQIRKIIGLTIKIVSGHADKSIIEQALSNLQRVDVPKAPGLGLVLDEVHYQNYNKRFEKTHEKLSWEKCEEDVKKFRGEFIDSVIVEKELKEKSMLDWLTVLENHNDSRCEEFPANDDRSSSPE